VNYDDSTKKHEDSPPPTTQKVMANATEPGLIAGREKHVSIPDAYSVQPGDAQNRVAQADGVAAHHAEANQSASSSRSKSKRAPDPHVAKIVQEENESRSKFPKYPGLERWELLEKMGDGAFSNVYRARDRQGDTGEVAIKVVRKYEMNNMQVSVLAVPISFFFTNVAVALQGQKHLHPDFKKVPKAVEVRELSFLLSELLPLHAILLVRSTLGHYSDTFLSSFHLESNLKPATMIRN
jgi:serine/threonine-protein kinase RCK2